MKILVVGAGGIGSWLVEEIAACMEQGQIDAFTEITVADNDIVEVEQVKYQNFQLEEAGMIKAKALAQRFKAVGIKAKPERIEKESQLKGYDFIVMCVDNDITRELVIRHCHKEGTDFLDLRATGRHIFVMPKRSLKQNLSFIDSQDKGEYSCQEEEDLEQGLVQKGNKIAAMIGLQMLLNSLRGHENKEHSLTV
ncbi:MAG: ThiF family adenylyltransferase [Candidatus Micrarchaeota archaeon]